VRVRADVDAGIQGLVADAAELRGPQRDEVAHLWAAWGWRVRLEATAAASLRRAKEGRKMFFEKKNSWKKLGKKLKKLWGTVDEKTRTVALQTDYYSSTTVQ
jgi:hypothetical protein